MWVTCLGFALLLWIPGELHGQGVKQACRAPSLDHGYFLPEMESYPHETHIRYACDNGYKPKVEGWWAIAICKNGNWFHEPQCIKETACIPPTIPNAKAIQTSTGFFEHGHQLAITCNNGYVPKKQQTVAQCEDGAWSSVPVCEKNPRACNEPPQIPFAVITHQKYQEVFDMGSEVEYQCADGYVTETKQTKKSITCNNGNWTEGPVCKSAALSESNEGDSQLFLSIDKCGEFPDVPNSLREQDGQRSLKYRCVLLYKLVGPGTVVCHSNGKWSEVPTCKENFCKMNTAEYPDLINVGVEYIENGETKELDCTNVHIFTNYSVVKCVNGKLQKTRCCNRVQISTGSC
ncbi:complement factor H [Austrofundulus limnaeus]|uniref:Complement factor H n=1 Tax=Austrofundulus limnaeus TaxID=52670 RepID=A0A2I4CB09_AUSLI|nr:PREDICTED: complement factor H-like [Austrofundulus limnaeus]